MIGYGGHGIDEIFTVRGPDGKEIKADSDPGGIACIIHTTFPRMCEMLMGSPLDGKIPILTMNKPEEGGTIFTLNLQTYTHEEFAPDKEQFLPPRPLTIKNWPTSAVEWIRREIKYPYNIRINAPNHVGFYFYNDNLLVLANFNSTPAACTIHPATIDSDKEMKLHPQFPLVEDVHLEKMETSKSPCYSLLSSTLGIGVGYVGIKKV